MISYITIILCQNGSWVSDLLVNILAAIIFLLIYELLIKNAWTYFKNRPIRGKYIHCGVDFYAHPLDKTEKSNSIIKVNFFRPNILTIESVDNNHDNDNIWKGEIKINSGKVKEGFGTFSYTQGLSIGNHKILIYDNETIYVQLFNYSEKNVTYNYLWIREGSKKIKIK